MKKLILYLISFFIYFLLKNNNYILETNINDIEYNLIPGNYYCENNTCEFKGNNVIYKKHIGYIGEVIINGIDHKIIGYNIKFLNIKFLKNNTLENSNIIPLLSIRSDSSYHEFNKCKFLNLIETPIENGEEEIGILYKLSGTKRTYRTIYNTLINTFYYVDVLNSEMWPIFPLNWENTKYYYSNIFIENEFYFKKNSIVFEYKKNFYDIEEIPNNMCIDGKNNIESWLDGIYTRYNILIEKNKFYNIKKNAINIKGIDENTSGCCAIIEKIHILNNIFYCNIESINESIILNINFSKDSYTENRVKPFSKTDPLYILYYDIEYIMIGIKKNKFYNLTTSTAIYVNTEIKGLDIENNEFIFNKIKNLPDCIKIIYGYELNEKILPEYQPYIKISENKIKKKINIIEEELKNLKYYLNEQEEKEKGEYLNSGIYIKIGYDKDINNLPNILNIIKVLCLRENIYEEINENGDIINNNNKEEKELIRRREIYLKYGTYIKSNFTETSIFIIMELLNTVFENKYINCMEISGSITCTTIRINTIDNYMTNYNWGIMYYQFFIGNAYRNNLNLIGTVSDIKLEKIDDIIKINACNRMFKNTLEYCIVDPKYIREENTGSCWKITRYQNVIGISCPLGKIYVYPDDYYLETQINNMDYNLIPGNYYCSNYQCLFTGSKTTYRKDETYLGEVTITGINHKIIGYEIRFLNIIFLKNNTLENSNKIPLLTIRSDSSYHEFYKCKFLNLIETKIEGEEEIGIYYKLCGTRRSYIGIYPSLYDSFYSVDVLNSDAWPIFPLYWTELKYYYSNIFIENEFYFQNNSIVFEYNKKFYDIEEYEISDDICVDGKNNINTWVDAIHTRYNILIEKNIFYNIKKNAINFKSNETIENGCCAMIEKIHILNNIFYCNNESISDSIILNINFSNDTYTENRVEAFSRTNFFFNIFYYNIEYIMIGIKKNKFYDLTKSTPIYINTEIKGLDIENNEFNYNKIKNLPDCIKFIYGYEFNEKNLPECQPYIKISENIIKKKINKTEGDLINLKYYLNKQEEKEKGEYLNSGIYIKIGYDKNINNLPDILNIITVLCLRENIYEEIDENNNIINEGEKRRREIFLRYGTFIKTNFKETSIYNIMELSNTVFENKYINCIISSGTIICTNLYSINNVGMMFNIEYLPYLSYMNFTNHYQLYIKFSYRNNLNLIGTESDIKLEGIVETNKIETCNKMFKNTLEYCIMDPINIKEENSGACWDVTRYGNMKGSLICPHINIFIYPTNYEVSGFKIIGHFLRLLIENVYIEEFNIWDPFYENVNIPIKIKLMNYEHLYFSNINEYENYDNGKTKNPILNIKNNIDLICSNIYIEDLIFDNNLINNNYIFTSSYKIAIPKLFKKNEIIFKNNIFTGNNGFNDIFSSLNFNNDMYFLNNKFFNMKKNILPKHLNKIIIKNNIFEKIYDGIIFITITETFIFENNFGNETYIENNNQQTCLIGFVNGNNTSSINNNYFISDYQDKEPIKDTSLYCIKNSKILKENIFNNSYIGAANGITYNFLENIQCDDQNSQFLYEQNNLIKGFRCDIKCNDLCTKSPFFPPPLFCLLNFTNNFYDQFIELHDAIEKCKSIPINIIYVMEGIHYMQKNIIIKKKSYIIQDILIIKPFNFNFINKPIIFIKPFILYEDDVENYINNFIYTEIIIENIIFKINNFEYFINWFSGYVKNIKFINVEFQGNFNVECFIKLNYLFNITFDNCIFNNTLNMALHLTNINKISPNFENINNELNLINNLGENIKGSFLESYLTFNINMENNKCIYYCGGMIEQKKNFIFIDFLNIKQNYTKNKFSINIQNNEFSINDLNLQNLGNVQGGYYTGFFLLNLNYVIDIYEKIYIKLFNIKNNLIKNFNVAFRIKNINNNILLLNEPINHIPFYNDSFRYIRELSFLNLNGLGFNGIFYDIKNGDASKDIFFDLSNACNDLCLPIYLDICYVSKTFNLINKGNDFNKNFFDSINTAVSLCEKYNEYNTKIIMLVEETLHIENIILDNLNFNVTITAEQNYFILQSNIYIGTNEINSDIIFKNLNIKSNPLNFPPTSIISNYHIGSIINSNIYFENINFFSDFEDAFEKGILYLENVLNIKISLKNIEINSNFFFIYPIEKNFLIYIDYFTPGSFYSNNLIIRRSVGSALYLNNIKNVIIENSFFYNCGTSNEKSIYTCIYIKDDFTLSGILLFKNNYISGMFFPQSNLINQPQPISITLPTLPITLKTFPYFIGLTIHTNITQNPHSTFPTYLLNIENNIIDYNIHIGILIMGWNLSNYINNFYPIPPKTLPRTLSHKNPLINTIFNDIVIYDNYYITNSIVLHEENFCNDECPIGFVMPKSLYWIILLPIIFIPLFIFIFCCLFCFCLLTNVEDVFFYYIYDPIIKKKKNKNKINTTKKNLISIESQYIKTNYIKLNNNEPQVERQNENENENENNLIKQNKIKKRNKKKNKKYFQ